MRLPRRYCRHEFLPDRALCGFSRVISLAPLLLPSDAVALALITHGSIVQRTIEELAEQVHQLQLPMQFHSAIGQTFALDEVAHVLPRGGDGPDKVAVGHALLGSRRS